MQKKILLVDDEVDIVRTLRKRLETNNYEVITAFDGLEALEKVKKERPDLVILDLMLPKMDGYKVCGLLKKDTRYSKIPIVIFTARAEKQDKKTGMQIGADAYIVKPFEPRILLDKLKELLEAGGSMLKKKVLLVDDEKDLLRLIGARIESWGYGLITAADGKTAIEAVKKQKPDIVILDYIMPGMDGVEVLKEIRKIDKKIPAIMFTAHPDTRSIKGTEKLGISSYIPKLSMYSEGVSSLRSVLNMLSTKKGTDTFSG